jgi:hypothetical protein
VDFGIAVAPTTGLADAEGLGVAVVLQTVVNNESAANTEMPLCMR